MGLRTWSERRFSKNIKTNECSRPGRIKDGVCLYLTHTYFILGLQSWKEHTYNTLEHEVYPEAGAQL